MYQDMSNKNNKSRKGFTLVEIAMSMVIFGVVVIMLSLPVYTGLNLLVDDSSIVKANNLAKAYIRDLEDKWKIQMNYDTAELIEVDSAYTNNGKYTVNVAVEDIQTDEDNIVIVRRIKVTYKNQKEEVLTDIFYDFNRPDAMEGS